MCKILPRIKELADQEGITIGALVRSIGASKGVLSRAINNGTDIQSKWLQAIVENYPRYSAQWLLSGEGEMILNENSQSSVKAGDNNFSRLSQYQRASDSFIGAIPLVSEKAVGGISNEYFSIKKDDVLGYYIIPKFRNLGVDFLIEVTGDSMMPHLSPGDIIACSIIRNSKFIQWNKCHLIATREQGLIIKRIMPAESNDNLKAVSDNKDYPPFDIPKDEIISMARVVGSIHLE